MEESVTAPRKLILVVISILALSPLMFSSATNVYITQNGSSQGSCTTNPQAPAWFNSASNWGSGGTQIGPGTTVLLCGTITTPLTFQGSGTSSSPITLTFDTGASITLSVCPSSGCLNISSKTYIVVDGGTTCGWISQSLTSCNGAIQSTASGSAFGNGGTSAYGIEATNCGYCEIRNLTIADIYQHTSSTDAQSGDFRAVDQGGISTPGATFLVHNNVIHDSSDGLDYTPGSSNDSGMQYYNNYSYNMNITINVANTNNGDITAALVHDNHFGATANWDTTSPLCAGHHNSMHAWAYTTTNSGIQYYNNLIDGDWGNCATSELFYEGSGSLNNNCTVFNNLFLATYQQENNGVVSISCGGALKFFNNTILGDSQPGDTCLSLNLNSGGAGTVENNVISGCNTLFESQAAVGSWTAMNYNVWAGDSSGTPWAVSCGNSGCSYFSFSGWKTACSCDSHSLFNSSMSYAGVGPNGALQSGSPAIGAGTNLASLGIAALNSDMDGLARPGGSSPWDSGPLNFNSSAAPAPPTGLSVVIQ
jgi:hypothetical protein